MPKHIAEVARKLSAETQLPLSKCLSVLREVGENYDMAKASLDPLIVINQLSRETGMGMLSCRKALLDSSGDIEKAKKMLRDRSALVVSRR
jgi:translation elongation factor EF-Ts